MKRDFSKQVYKDRSFKPGKEKVICPVCNKPVKVSGYEAHFAAAHPDMPVQQPK